MSITLAPIFKKAYWSLAALGGIYVVFISSLTIPWVQRQALYAHSFHSAWWHDLGLPEQWGYLDGQINALNIRTPDGETLYGWHILPVGEVSEHQAALLASPNRGDPRYFTTSTAFKLLQDPQAKLVISFHGNAGHVGQGWRTDHYRALGAADVEHIHVLAFDYRGFGRSTGTPTEDGLIRDGIAVVHWALEVAKIPPERIVFAAQSLGVAVSIAVAENFAVHEGIDFPALVAIAGFSDLRTLMKTYTILHAIPILSPLKPYPRILEFFSSRIVDAWPSSTRLSNLVKKSKNFDLTLIHARNDYDIPWQHSTTLFHAAVNATSSEGLTVQQIHAVKEHNELARGGFVNSWKAATDQGGIKQVKQIIVRDGGHNRVMSYALVTRAIRDAFKPRAKQEDMDA